MDNKVFCCNCVHLGPMCQLGHVCDHPDLQIKGAIDYITGEREESQIILCKDHNSQGNCKFFSGKPVQKVLNHG